MIRVALGGLCEKTVKGGCRVQSINRTGRVFAFVLTVVLLAVLILPTATHFAHADQQSFAPALAAPTISEIVGVQEGQSIKGRVNIEARVAGSNISKVVFNVSGPKTNTSTDRVAPYYY